MTDDSALMCASVRSWTLVCSSVSCRLVTEDCVLDRRAQNTAQLILRFGDLFPQFLLAAAHAGGQLRAFGSDLELGRTERHGALLAPSAPAPPLHAEGGDRQLAGLGGRDEIHGDHAVLFAAFHDVAGLDVDLRVGNVLDGQLMDILRSRGR